jgi:Protein of unknown function (DUF3237)
VTLTRGLWLADLESGDGFGGRAAGLGQQLVAVVDAEGMVGGLDGQGPSSVDDSDVNALPCNGYGAAAADPTFDLDGFWLGWWSGGSGVADACQLCGCQWVGQAAQPPVRTPRGRRHKAARRQGRAQRRLSRGPEDQGAHRGLDHEGVQGSRLRFDVAVIRESPVFLAALRSGQETGFDNQYIRMSPQFETGAAGLGWLTSTRWIGEGRLAGPHQIEYRIHRVD